MLLFRNLGARECLRDRVGGRVKVQKEHAYTENDVSIKFDGCDFV